MRKIYLNVLALYLCFLGSAQQKSDSVYENRPLKVEEVNFISGYYSQNGDHSAITGGSGSEKLNDISNTLDLRLVKQSNRYEHAIDVNLGVEHRTSASTEYIDKTPEGRTTVANSAQGALLQNLSTVDANSQASSLFGWRFAPSVNWNVKDLPTNRTVGLGAYFSYEFDYISLGGELSFVKASMDNNREFSVKGQAFFDRRQMIPPLELRGTDNATLLHDHEYGDYFSYTWRNKNSYSINAAFSQVVNQRLQLSVLTDIAYQQGILSKPFNRVYFNNGTVYSEKLPDTRLKIPVGLRLHYFAGSNLIFRVYYRYYWDNWGIRANTASLEVPMKITPNFSVSPFYRFSAQTATKYFNEYGTANPEDEYFTSNHDLSKFNSNNIGLNLHLVPNTGNFFNSIDLRYSHYERTDGLNANNITVAFKFK
ncbi:MAG: DUF3570 domain-containing protein [Tannerella sp.]|jgi:hypothetical protein|nr:DUF3570 domain-containing protein [Tannerella sp.]